MKLENKVAIITGANRGLGEAIARAYAAEGAHLILGARDAEPLKAVAESLPRQGGQQIECLPADISKAEDVNALAQKALDTFGRVDILVNNAGVYGPIGPIEEIDWDAWVEALQINLFGTLLMTRAVIPALK